MKLLNKRLTSIESVYTNSKEINNNSTLEDGLNIESNTEIKKLQTENIKLKAENENLCEKLLNSNETDVKLNKKEDTILKLTNKAEQLNNNYNEEKSKVTFLTNQVSDLEEALITLNKEYESMTSKYVKIVSDNESTDKITNDLRKNNNENKNKFEELARINQDLKVKIIESESVIKLHLDDTKNLIRKNTILTKKVDVNIKYYYF